MSFRFSNHQTKMRASLLTARCSSECCSSSWCGYETRLPKLPRSVRFCLVSVISISEMGDDVGTEYLTEVSCV